MNTLNTGYLDTKSRRTGNQYVSATSVITVSDPRASYVLFENLVNGTVRTVSKRVIQRVEVKRKRIKNDSIHGLVLDTTINHPSYTMRY